MMIVRFIFLFLYIKCIEMVKVKTADGILEGEKLLNSIGDQTYYSFKGVPYAAPPVGKLRFMPPQPPVPWKGIRSAKEHGCICAQEAVSPYSEGPGSEDCLYLNVYTPNIKPERPLPVMFFIHGGRYLFGSGNSDIYGPDFLIRYGIVLVTINYRLGLLGFLCLDIKEAPGNIGLKDQTAALKWVNKNIKNFGGDPDNVTIFGQSAGGNSVNAHLFSPLSKGLFKRAISLSASVLNDVFRSFESKRRGLAVTRQLGLDTKNTTEAFYFLKGLPVEKLIGINASILASEDITYAVGIISYFVPVIEKKFDGEHFVTENPVKQLFQCGEFDCVDLIIGHTDKEALDAVYTYEDTILQLYPQFAELLVPIKITRVNSPKKVLDLSRIINEYYFGDKSINLSTIRQFINFYTYYNYVYDIDRFARSWGRGCNNTYYYIFRAVTERNYFAKRAEKFNVSGASHNDDLLYLFGAKKFNLTLDVNSTAFRIIDNICTLYTNFAKYGNPTPEESSTDIWPRYGKKRNYVFIDEGLEKQVVTYKEDLGFWKSILEKAGLVY